VRRFKFKQVDVFTRVPFFGNPVAVVLDAGVLDSGEMQQFATWTNLSETTFVLPPEHPEADYRLRIFTPNRELTFAGHPTVGSAHAVLEHGNIKPDNGRLVQECGVGLVELEVFGAGGERRIMVNSPVPRITPWETSLMKDLEQALRSELPQGYTPLVVDVGPRWLVVGFPTREAVQALEPDFALTASLNRASNTTGITVFGFSGGDQAAVYVRSFAPAEGIPEDPVCGSGNISVGAYLLHKGLQVKTGNAYLANQGRELGRDGHVYVELDPETASIRIGGHAVTCIDGYLSC
jgi:PhzF family phenazine biosynthesis protein